MSTKTGEPEWTPSIRRASFPSEAGTPGLSVGKCLPHPRTLAPPYDT